MGWIKNLTFGAVCIASLGYGMAAGRYDLPPAPQLAALKRTVTGPELILEEYSGRYAARRDTLAKIQGKATYAFLGDSHIEWAEWDELIGDPYAVNRGIAGDTTAGVLRRLPDVLAMKPHTVVILVGVNDARMGIPAQIIAANIQKIAQQIRASGARPVICAIIRVDETRKGPRGTNAIIDEVNKSVFAWARGQKIDYVKINRQIAPDGTIDPRFTHDGVHLTAEGYFVLRDTIKAAL